jgi:hypothetical protein
MKMIANLIIWTLNRIFRKPTGQLRKQLTPTIKKLYQRIARDELTIKCEIIETKKGKRKYDLLIIEDSLGKRRMQISRHLIELHNNTMEIPAN